MRLYLSIFFCFFASIGMAQNNPEKFSGKVVLMTKEEGRAMMLRSHLANLKKQIAPLNFSAEQEQQLLTSLAPIKEEQGKISARYQNQRDSLLFYLNKTYLKEQKVLEKIFTKEQLKNYKAYQEKRKAEVQKYQEILNQRRGMLKEE